MIMDETTLTLILLAGLALIMLWVLRQFRSF